MKGKNLLALVFLLIASPPETYSQEITLGAYTGVNLSDIHGNIEPGRWEFNPGPVQGISADFSYKGLIGFSTGFIFSTVYHEYTPYYNTDYPPYDFQNCATCIGPFFYYPVKTSMNFSSFTVPVTLKITLPAKPELSISAGMFYSRAYDYSLTYINSEVPEKNDYGFIYSAGLSYPVSRKIKATLNVSYLTGRKEIFENQSLRHGSVDFTVGLAYMVPGGKKSEAGKSDTAAVNNRIEIIYTGGVNLSQNKVKSYNEKYSMNYGPSLGFLVNFRVGRGASFRTGLMFERTGYSMKDSSDLFYRYVVAGNADYYVDSRMSIDYISIPALLNIYIGKSQRVSVFTGPYYAFFLNARCTGTAYRETSSPSGYDLTKTNINDDLERIIKGDDIGWIIGGSVSLPVSKKLSFDVGVQYRFGFGEVFEKENSGEYNVPSFDGLIIRNSSVSIHAGIKVPLQK